MNWPARHEVSGFYPWLWQKHFSYICLRYAQGQLSCEHLHCLWKSWGWLACNLVLRIQKVYFLLLPGCYFQVPIMVCLASDRSKGDCWSCRWIAWKTIQYSRPKARPSPSACWWSNASVICYFLLEQLFYYDNAELWLHMKIWSFVILCWVHIVYLIASIILNKLMICNHVSCGSRWVYRRTYSLGEKRFNLSFFHCCINHHGWGLKIIFLVQSCVF